MEFLEFILELFGLNKKNDAMPTDPSLPRKCNHYAIIVTNGDGSVTKFCRFCRKPWAELVAAGEVPA